MSLCIYTYYILRLYIKYSIVMMFLILFFFITLIKLHFIICFVPKARREHMHFEYDACASCLLKFNGFEAKEGTWKTRGIDGVCGP